MVGHGIDCLSAPNAIRHDVAQILAILSTQPGAGVPSRGARERFASGDPDPCAVLLLLSCVRESFV